MDVPIGKQIVCTYENRVIISNNKKVYDHISPTFHEEADARLLLHVWHASIFEGHTKINIKTVESDVVVIAMYAFSMLDEVEELWIEYGTGTHLQSLNASKVKSMYPGYQTCFPSSMLLLVQTLIQVLVVFISQHEHDFMLPQRFVRISFIKLSRNCQRRNSGSGS
ncbi:unnamed protein product [Ceutorhynchus assimilis]|uniref:Uncharacterized protein n=1 Tax=Ceutorhynchus assimilis TaxID=467358 RepID=A0A9N9MC94_9CUCU|nr:unnamed protein product [Ceutorhynchus assimilis]